MPERGLSLKYIGSGFIVDDFRKLVFIRLEQRISIAKASFEERIWGVYIPPRPQNLNFERSVQKVFTFTLEGTRFEKNDLTDFWRPDHGE